MGLDVGQVVGQAVNTIVPGFGTVIGSAVDAVGSLFAHGYYGAMYVVQPDGTLAWQQSPYFGTQAELTNWQLKNLANNDIYASMHPPSAAGAAGYSRLTQTFGGIFGQAAPAPGSSLYTTKKKKAKKTKKKRSY